MDIITRVIREVVIAIYQPFWCAVFISALIMYFYIFSTDKTVKSGLGYKENIKLWIRKFTNEKKIRSVFFFVFYTAMILLSTLLNRDVWVNPLSNVMGDWWIYKIDPATGEKIITTDSLENFILFIPFIYLLLHNFCDRIVGNKKSLIKIIWNSVKISFLLSMIIESIQLFLRLGTFQLSDLFYNTLGGLVGGIIYFIGYKIAEKRKGKQ